MDSGKIREALMDALRFTDDEHCVSHIHEALATLPPAPDWVDRSVRRIRTIINKHDQRRDFSLYWMNAYDAMAAIIREEFGKDATTTDADGGVYTFGKLDGIKNERARIVADLAARADTLDRHGTEWFERDSVMEIVRAEDAR